MNYTTHFHISLKQLEEIENSSLKVLIENSYMPIAFTQYNLEDTFIFNTTEQAKECYDELEVDKKLVCGWFYGKEEFEIHKKEYEELYQTTMLIKRIFYAFPKI
jgi:hypothetical protein